MISTGSFAYDFVGLSTDDKSAIIGPTNGSTFLEMDTGDVYIYSAENTTWYKL